MEAEKKNREYPRRHFIHGRMLFHRNGCDECSNLKLARKGSSAISLGQPKATIKDSTEAERTDPPEKASDVSAVAEN